MAVGGGTVNPIAIAGIADDFNNNTIVPLENVTFATGTAAPIAGEQVPLVSATAAGVIITRRESTPPTATLGVAWAMY